MSFNKLIFIGNTMDIIVKLPIELRSHIYSYFTEYNDISSLYRVLNSSKENSQNA